MSLQPISSSQLQFDTGNPLLTRSLSVRVGLAEHLSAQQVLERALMQALNSTEVGVARAFLRQSGLQLNEVPARQQFDQHAVYSFTPPPSFWSQLATFRQEAGSGTGGVTNATGQPTAAHPTRNQIGAEAFAIRNLFALLKARWLQALSGLSTNSSMVNPRINATQPTVNGQTQPAAANGQPAGFSQPQSTLQTASATPTQLTPQTLVTMSPEQLKAQPEAAKKQLLKSLGVSDKDLKKLKGDKLDKALAELAKALRTPGKHKVTLNLDKKYELKTQIGTDGQIESFGLKKKKGFFGKLWDGVKAIAPIAGYVLAPFTGGLSLVASAAIGAVDAVKNKNWLGAITSAAGAFVPGAGNIAGKAFGQIASTVQKVAFTAQSAFAAVEGRNPLSLVGAVAGGFGNIAGGIENVSSKVLENTQQVQRWANLALRGQSIIKAASSGDFFGAATGALGTAAGLTKDSTLKSDLAKYADWADRANTAQWAIRTKNYAAAANTALNLAVNVRQQANVKVNGRDWLSDALRLTETGAGLQGALRSKDPLLMSGAVLSLGGALDTFRSGSLEAGGVEGELGAGLYRAANMLQFAETAIRAVKEGRTSDAAAFGLGLAAELSGDQRMKQAAEVGQSAVTLVRAIRSKNVMMLKLAGESFMKEVGLGRFSAERYRDQLLAQARERLENQGANVTANQTNDLASRLGLTPSFTTLPFVASSSEAPALDAPPVLGRQLFEPQVVTPLSVPPLFSTTPSFIPARFVAPVEDVESDATSTKGAGLQAEMAQRIQGARFDRDAVSARAGQPFAATNQTLSSDDSLVARNNQTVGQVSTVATAQPQATSGADFEARAQHLYERLHDYGPLGLNGRTPLVDIWSDLAGLSPAEAKNLIDIYQKKYGQNLLAAVAGRLPTMAERRRAFEILAPQKVHEQINPLASSQGGAGIIADPPVSEVIEGTSVNYRFSPPPAIRAEGYPKDFVRFAYQDAPDAIGDAGTTFSATYDKAENRRVTFEVYQPGNRVPEYYTMLQLVRKPEDASGAALQGLEGFPTDAELLMKGVDLQTEMLEKRLGELKTELAKYPPDSIFQMQPPEQKQLKVQIERVETALTELRAVKDSLPGKLFNGAVGKPVALKAAFVATQNPRPIPLQLYAKSLGNDTWAIVDATNPSDSQIYQGSAGTGLKGAWETFSKQNNLPAGSVAANLPNTGKVFAQGQGGSDLKTWASRTGLISIGLAAAGVASLFVFPPAAPFLFGGASFSGAVSGGLNIADRLTYGNFRWQSTETALDVLSIAGGIAGIGGAAKLGAAARTITTAEGATVQVSRVGNFIKIAQGVEQGAAAGGVMLISAEYAQAFERLNSLPPAERDKQAAALYKTALAAGAIVVFGGVAVSRFARLAPQELNTLVQKAKLSPELEALVRQEPGLQKLLEREGGEKIQQLHDDYIRSRAAGRATSETFIDYVPHRGYSVSTGPTEVALTDALGISSSKLQSLAKRQLNEQILKEINPQLIEKYQTGQLPRGVEAALDNVLNRDLGLTAQSTLGNARGAISKELNAAIGSNVNAKELAEILDLFSGSANSGNRGSIGNAYYRTHLAEGQRIQEFPYSSEIWTGKPSIERRADDLLVTGRRTVDIKTGYPDGYPKSSEDVAQLQDYNSLVRESRLGRNVKLKKYLEEAGVQGGVLKSHDYLFLPSGGTKAEDAARESFRKIEGKLLATDRANIRVFYLGEDGKIYQLVTVRSKQPPVSKLVGDKLPN